MKFFSLIDKSKSVHAAPGKKVIPSEVFSSLKGVEDILELAKKDVEEYKKQAEEECEKLKEEAKEAGFNEGLQQWSDKLAKFEKDVEEIRKEIEKAVAPLALKAAKKIVSKEIELDERIVVDIVCNALRAVSHHKKVTIYVNKSDLSALESNRPALKEVLENVEMLSVQDREDVEPLGCIIETEGGIINAQIENQWRALETAFETLMKQ